MKKVIFLVAIATITVTAMLYDVNVKSEANNNVTIENAEALATGGVHMVGCWNSGGCTAGAYHSTVYKGWLLIGNTVVEQ